MQTKTINQWMKEWGYVWVPGREELYKSEMDFGNAQMVLADLARQGSVRRGR